jgi:hypothetical protein
LGSDVSESVSGEDEAQGSVCLLSLSVHLRSVSASLVLEGDEEALQATPAPAPCVRFECTGLVVRQISCAATSTCGAREELCLLVDTCSLIGVYILVHRTIEVLSRRYVY